VLFWVSVFCPSESFILSGGNLVTYSGIVTEPICSFSNAGGGKIWISKYYLWWRVLEFGPLICHSPTIPSPSLVAFPSPKTLSTSDYYCNLSRVFCQMSSLVPHFCSGMGSTARQLPTKMCPLISHMGCGWQQCHTGTKDSVFCHHGAGFVGCYFLQVSLPLWDPCTTCTTWKCHVGISGSLGRGTLCKPPGVGVSGWRRASMGLWESMLHVEVSGYWDGALGTMDCVSLLPWLPLAPRVSILCSFVGN
jgi:hypothetical protein